MRKSGSVTDPQEVLCVPARTSSGSLVWAVVVLCAASAYIVRR